MNDDQAPAMKLLDDGTVQLHLCWKKHQGKQCPVERKQRVVVVRANGVMSVGQAGYYNWTLDEDRSTRIALYCIIEIVPPSDVTGWTGEVLKTMDTPSMTIYYRGEYIGTINNVHYGRELVNFLNSEKLNLQNFKAKGEDDERA